VVCLSADGSLRWKQPVEAGIPWGSATVSDPERDGVPGIFWVSLSGLVECLAPDGSEVWTFQIVGGGPQGPLAVGDVDGDGFGEIITGGGPRSVHCLDHQGEVKWRFDGLAHFDNGAVLADVTGNENPEVLIASDIGILQRR